MIAARSDPALRAAAWTHGAMQPEDLPRVLVIERASFPTPWTAALFLQELTLPFSRVLVARTAAPPVPTVIGYACRWVVADEMQIVNVAVDPAYRRRHVARALLRDLLAEAHRLVLASIVLEVRARNEPARRLYASLGFDAVGVRRHYYGRGEDATTMRLTVAHA